MPNQAEIIKAFHDCCKDHPIITKFLPDYEFKYFGFDGGKAKKLYYNNKKHEINQIITYRNNRHDFIFTVSYINNNNEYFRDDGGAELIRISNKDLHISYGYGQLECFISHKDNGPSEKRFSLTTNKQTLNVWKINGSFSRFDGPCEIKSDYFQNVTWMIDTKYILPLPVVHKGKLYYEPITNFDLSLAPKNDYDNLDDVVVIRSHSNHLINQALILETSLFNREYGKYVYELFKQNKIGE